MFNLINLLIIIIQEMSKEQNTPQFIKQLPWYAQDSKGGGELIKIPQHQPKGFIDEWYNRAEKGYQSATFRKGACENCGAMGHSKKDCTQRPRKLAAKYTNRNIATDDVVKDVRMNWEIKRDRWNGYTPDMYGEVIEDFKKYEDVRKKVKGQDLDDQMRVRDNPLLSADLPSANKKQKFQGLGGVRNREDRAKYLLNLGSDAATFDPKSRTLAGQDDYLKELSNLQAVGEKAFLEEQDRFAFQQVEKHHSQLSSTALPTLTEKIFKNVKQKQAGLNSGKMGQIMRKYGVEAPSDQGGLKVVVQQNEGDEIYTKIRPSAKSKYEQDIFINDHSSVWGSWYNKYLGWGYDCCHSNQKMSYCIGLKGRQKALARQLKVKTQEIKELQKLKQIEQLDTVNHEQENKIQ